MSRIACIVQARMGSKRLPGKVLADIGGKPMLWHVLRRVKEIGLPYIVAIPHHDPPELIELANQCGAMVATGPEDDVLARYYQAAQGYDAVMRVTADCPFLDPEACRRVLKVYELGAWEWVANDAQPSYPLGLGCEVFSFGSLKWAHETGAKTAYDHEHVSPAIIKRRSGINLWCVENYVADLRLTVDTQEDLDFVRKVDAAQPADFSLRATLEAVARAQA